MYAAVDQYSKEFFLKNRNKIILRAFISLAFLQSGFRKKSVVLTYKNAFPKG